MNLVECFDVGGTSIRYALIQDEKILEKKGVSSVQGDFKKIIEIIRELSAQGRVRAGKKSVDCTVVGLPGPVRGDTLLNSAPLGLSNAISLRPLMETFPNPVHAANDLNLAVQAEFHRGAGKHADSFSLLTLSTGIGAGIVWQKKMLDGPIGEFGHCILDTHESAPACTLPHRGCWAAFSSGAGIQRRAEKEFARPISPEEVFSLAAKNDPIAQKIIARARAANAQGMGTLLNAFGVEELVVMGSVGLNHFSAVIPSKGEIAPFAVHPIPPIVPTQLGDDIGLWGAYFAGVSLLKK